MASGGEHSPSKRPHPSAESANQSTGFSDQWTFPNNLELNTHSKTNRKHKNKEKVRSKATHEVSSPSSPGITRSAGNALSFHTFPRSKLSTASWLKDQLDNGGLSKRNTRSELDEEVSDVEQGVKHRRNFNTPINQRHQTTRFQKSSHGSVGNDAINVPVNQRHQSTRFQNAQGNSRNESMENENSKSMKQDNTKKLTDSSMLVERLMQLHELIAQVNSILKNLEKSDEPVAREYKTELGTMIKKLTEEEREHINLLQQIMACDPNVNGVTPPSESSQAKGCFSHRDLHRNEEDKTNKQNHFLEQVKESQEKLTALKEQQAILVSLQKQAEDKLAAFHAQILKSSADHVLAEDWQYASSERSAHSGMDEGVVNGDSEWENDVYQNSKPLRPSANLQKMKNSPQENIHSSVWQDDSQASSHTSTENRKPVSQMIQEGESENYHLSKPVRQSTNSQKMKNSVQENMHSLAWQEESQASGHHSAESHKSVSQIFQELSDNKNMTEQLSADESELTDARDSFNDLEWRRKRLKNKLTELREKQLQNDQLKRELSSHNETAKVTAAKFGEGDECSASQDNQQFLSMSVEQNKRKLEELQETIMQLSGFMNGIAPAINSEDESSVNKEPDEADFGATSSRNFPASQNIHHVAPMKRENIRKEQSSGFPARRHYEAEGRANEDPDVPSVAPPAVSPTPNQNSWDDDPRIQQKIRKLKEAKDKLKKIQGILNTIQEYKQSGRRVPVEYLQLLQSLAAAEKSEYEASGIDDNEEVKDDETDSLNQSNENEAVTHGSKLVTDDVTEAPSVQADNLRLDQVDLVLHHKRTLESLILERERLLKIHEQFMQLRNSFPSLQRNNDKVRSSGEGGNLKKKRTLHTSPLTPHSASDGALTVRLRQDNLLTRQNIATMESQNRNKSNTLGAVGESVTAKKENINNLSSKVTKHTLPNSSVRSLSESVSQDNNDVSSTFSAELNHSLSLRDELQHKVALDDLLSEDRSKQQGYHRNQDNQARSCSSVNSETLEGSNSVFAPDNTVAATWGGSSTQENFEDETEDPVESLEEQEEDDDDDENNNEETSTVDAEIPQNSTISNQFSNVQYVHTATSTAVKQRDKALQKDFRGSHLNQWNVKKNLAQCVINRGQTSRSSRLENFAPEDATAQVEDGTQPTGGATDGSVNSNLPSNFVQQLEQLNALCQSILQEQQSVPQNLQRNVFSCPLSNTGRQPRSTNDVMHHYTQQLQLQQQLLLSLSQCYHALYIQQLEIQHLHRCVQHNTDPETALHNPTAPPPVNSEDFTFRPWFLPPWLNAGVPPMPHQQGQMPSMCVPPLLQPPQQSFNFGATPAATASAPPCALVSGMQSARPVPNSCNQEVRPSAETLNNQVPPRTRANNFLDNFRSCSRQNLLSASSNNNIKSNESGRTQSVSQIRPVAPLSSNTVTWNQRAPEYVPAPDSSAPTYHAPERSLERPPANPELQELMTRTKKPNLSKPQAVPGGRSGSDFSRKPSSSVNIITPMVDHQSSRSNPFHSVNMDSLVTSTSNIGTRPLVLHPVPQQGSRTSALGFSNPTSTSSAEPMLVSIFSEVSKLVAHNSLPPDSLMELFQELQNLRSDGLLRALNAVKELARTEGSDRPSTTAAATCTNEYKNRVDTKTQDARANDSVDQASDSSLDSGDVPDGLDSDEPVAKRTAEDAGSHWNSSALPTATIPPFGKAQVSKPSTGAVKKRTLASRSVQPYSFSTSEPQDVNNGHSLHPNSSATKDISETLVERIIHDVLSCLHDHVMDECCPSLRSKISSRILDALKANSSSPLPLIFLSNLKQTLNLVIAKYSGLKVSECESDLLKSVAEVLFKELTHQRTASQRPLLDSGECSSSTLDVSNQPDVLPQTCKLSCGEEQKKHPKESSEMSRPDANLNYAAVSTEGAVDLISENCPTSTVDENSNSFQQSSGLLQLEAVRGAVGGENSYGAHASNWSSTTGNPEEDMGYECDPEAEAEPEVEIGTEADLAEADQSPGQQGVIASSASVDSGHLDAATAASSVHSYEENGTAEVDVPAESGAQALPDSVLEQEIGLDDIPTKLTPLSEEELQKQMNDEQEGNSVLSEVVEDFPLVGDSSAIREPASFLPADTCGKR